MADKTVKVQVTSAGLKETLTTAEKTNKELDKLEKPRKVRTSSTGSRAADAALLSTERDISTGLGRGTAAAHMRGDTRDFARQAQGLGGLVHVYATFAANIFAVGAAFTALSRAMDFERMISAAENLSTKTGTSIKNLANDIVYLTESTVSLKDAMASASLASVAGLTSKEIQGLAKAAKGASQTMGRDMTDALNRVFRGTIKIEPELLDELGLMVKVNDANREYAKEIGKTVIALTEQERRQAFVNAVLEKAETQYGSLTDSVESYGNVYQQLLSSILNLATQTGGILNTVFEPLLRGLASSPTALIATIGSLVSLLIRQAIPAIKDMGKAHVEGLQKYRDTVNIRKALLENEIKEAKTAADKKNLIERQAFSSQIEQMKQDFGKRSKLAERAAGFLGLDPKAIEKEVASMIKNIDTQIKMAKGRIASIQEKMGPFPEKELIAQQKLIETLTDKTIPHLEKWKTGIANIGSSAAGLFLSTSQEMDATKALIKEKQQLIQAEERLKFAIHKTHIVQVAESTGFINAIRNLGTQYDIVDEKGEKVATSTLNWQQKIRAGFSAATASLAGFISKIGIWGVAIGLAISLVSLVAESLGLLTDRYKDLTRATDSSNEANKTYVDTLENLKNSSNLLDIFDRNIAAINAQIEAIEKLSLATSKYQDLMSKGTAYERGLEGLKDKLPFIDSAAENIQKDIKIQYNALKPEELMHFQKLLNKNIGTDISDFNEFMKQIETVLTFAPGKSEDYSKAQQYLVKIQNTIEELNNPDSLKKFIEGLKGLKNAFTTISDNASNYLNLLNKTNKEYDSSISALSALQNVAKSLSAGNFDKLNTSLITFSQNLANLDFMVYSGLTNQDVGGIAEASKQLLEAQERINSNNNLSREQKASALSEEIEKIKQKFPTFMTDFMRAILKASKNLEELGNQAIDLKVAQATYNKRIRVLGVANTLAGETSERNLAIIKFQDALIDLQIRQLKVQQQMLQRLADLNVSKRDQALNLLAELKSPGSRSPENKGTSTLLYDTLSTSAIESKAEEATRLSVEAARENKDATSRLYGQVAEGLYTYLQNTLAYRTSTAENNANIAELSSQKSIASDKVLAAISGNTATINRISDLDNTFTTLNNTIKVVDSSFLEAITGITSFTSSYEETVNASKDKLNSINKEIDVLNSTKTDLTKAKELPEVKGDIVQLQSINERLQATIKELKNKELEKVLNSKELEVAKLTAEFKAFNIIFDGTINSLNKISDYHLQNVERLSSTYKSTERTLAEIKTAREQISKIEFLSHTREILQIQSLEKAAIILENELKITDDQVKVLQIKADLANIYSSILERNLNLQQLELDTQSKLYKLAKQQQRETLKKREENIYSPLQLFNEENLKDAAQIFVVAIKEEVETLNPYIQDLALGFKNALFESIDYLVDAFRKGELTLRSAIDFIRNALSDVFKDLAVKQFQKAAAKGSELLIKKIFPDLDLRTEKETLALTQIHVTETLILKLTELTTAIQNLNFGSLGEFKDSYDKGFKKFFGMNELPQPEILESNSPLITEIDTTSAAETFSLKIKEAIEGTPIGVQAPSSLYSLSNTTTAEPLISGIDIASANREVWVGLIEAPLTSIATNMESEFNTSLEIRTIQEQSRALLEQIASQSRAVEVTDDSFINPLETAAIGIDEGASKQEKAASTSVAVAGKQAQTVGVFGSIVRMFGGVGDLFLRAVQWLISGIGGGGGGEFNLFGAILGSAFKGIGSIFGGITNFIGAGMNAAEYGISMFGEQNAQMLAQYNPLTFAKGGIVDEIIKSIPAYASGAITSGPEVALIGEGKNKEAIVPLPDNRSIPVKLMGEMGGTVMGDTDITVNVTVNNTDSGTSTNTSVESSTKFGQELAGQIRGLVAVELINQQKPGGILYKR